MGNQDWVGAILGVLVIGLLIVAVQTWYVTVPVAGVLVAYFAWKNSPSTKEAQLKKKNQTLYDEAIKRVPQYDDPEEGWKEFVTNIVKRMPNLDKMPDEVWDEVYQCIGAFYELEPFEAPAIPKPPPIANSMDGAKYRDRLNDAITKFGDATARTVAEKVIAESLEWFTDELPKIAEAGEVLATVPLTDAFDSRMAIRRLIIGFMDDELKEHNLYKSVRDRLNANAHEVQEKYRGRELIYPDEYEGDDVVGEYLNGTPFARIFNAQLPFRVPEHIAYEHTAIVGGSGHGKTTALQKMIMGRIEQAKAGEGGFAVIDPKGSLIDLIAKQQCFSPDGGELTDKIIIIDPKRDIDFPPCLNMFDLGIDELKNLSKADRVGVKNNALDLIDYMFSDLLNVETTGRQQVGFKMVGELLMSIPDANIMTLLDFLNHPNDYQDYINQLDPTPRDYIQTQFIDVRFDTTRKALAERVYGILTLPMMEAMLDNKKNKVNLVDAINEGKVLLIKADESFLSTSGAKVFGGIWIALLFQACLSRANIPRDQRLGFTVFIDEASMFFSDRLRQLLIKAREYKLGAVFAFQDLDQIESKQMRASVMGSTSTKMVGGLNASDRRAFAQEMNCSEEYLKTPRKNEASLTTEFATYIRGVTETPLMLTFPIGRMDEEPQMSASQFGRLIDANRARVARNVDDIAREKIEEGALNENGYESEATKDEIPGDETERDALVNAQTSKEKEPQKPTRYTQMDYQPTDERDDL